MRSKLRIATSYVGLSLCIATVYLCAESHSTRLTVGRFNHEFDHWQVESFDGRLTLLVWTCQHDVPNPAKVHWVLSSMAGDTYRDMIASMPGALLELESSTHAPSFSFDRQRTTAARRYGAVEKLSVAAPHWFIVLIFGAFALFVRPKPRFRFSLRDAIAVITMVAVVVSALGAFIEYAKTR